MTATMIPPSPTPTPKPGGGALRHVSVRANLMPDEVLSARQTVVVRKQVMLGVLIVVALLIAWFGLSWWQTHAARGDLTDAQARGVSLQNQQKEYAPLVTAQTQIGTIGSDLHKLMAGDLSWTAMLTTLRNQAPSGITLTQVGGVISAGAATNGTTTSGQLKPSVLNVTGKTQIGALTVTGNAPSKDAIAAYADKLATVRGLTAPLITSTTTTAGSHTLTFTVNLVITTDALGGRYAAPDLSTATGGH
jgi:Tfp pilus assembly protein PilN